MHYQPIKFDIQKNGSNRIAVAIDTSGSITKIQRLVIRKTLKQLIELLAASGYFSLTIWAFDGCVDYRSIKKFDSYDKNTFDADVQHTLTCGGGGSNLDANFHLVEALGLLPDELFIITDGCVSISEDINYGSYKKHIVLFDKSYVPKTDWLPFEHNLHCLDINSIKSSKKA